jgi:hypothetical protein
VARAEKSIVVRVPVRTAYRWWTTYEEFPAFLDGVTKVIPRDERTQAWEVEIAGRAEQWETQVEARDEHHVAWHTTGRPHAEGEVELKPVEGGQALVTLRLVYDPIGEHDVEGASGLVDRLVFNSLERFKAFAEAHEQRRTVDDDAPVPLGAETVDGPEGERLGDQEDNTGDLPFSDHGRRHGGPMEAAPDGFETLLERLADAEPSRPLGADDMGKVFDPDAADLPERALDANEDDNEAQWSRLRP